MQLNTGIAIGGPLQGQTMTFQGVICYLPVDQDVAPVWDVSKPRKTDRVELETYNFHTLNTSDTPVVGPSGSWNFWVHQDVRQANKTILDYLVASHTEMQVRGKLLRRAYQALSGAPSRLSHRYLELREVPLLCQAIEPYADGGEL